MSIALRLGSPFVLVVLVSAMGVVAPASAVVGAKPIRTVLHPENFVVPAGQGCSFNVAEEVDERAWMAITEFADGRIVTKGRANPTLTNMDTGDSLVHHTSAKITETQTSEGEILVEVSGQLFMSFWPGDQGPTGLTDDPGGLFSINGHVRVTMDSSTFVYTSFSLDGTATDLCAALAPA